MISARQVALRFALEQIDLSGVKLTVGRGALGPTVNLISLRAPVDLTEEDLGWTAEPDKLKPKQFGKLELEKRFLGADDLPEGATEAFQGTKSRFGRLDVATVYAVSSVFVTGAFQHRGYGLVMYLKALEFVSSRGYWLVNDTQRSTSGSARATWKALFRYAQKTLEGPPPPESLWDDTKQEYVEGYQRIVNRPGGGWSRVVVPMHRPAMAAFGLNGAGRKILGLLG